MPVLITENWLRSSILANQPNPAQLAIFGMTTLKRGWKYKLYGRILTDEQADLVIANRRRPYKPKRRKAPRPTQAEKKLKRRHRLSPKLVRPDYYAYIKSSEWQEKRAEAFRHHGRKCNRCEKTSSLQIHHKHYRTLGREKMIDLEVLCGRCHRLHHEAAGDLPPRPLPE